MKIGTNTRISMVGLLCAVCAPIAVWQGFFNSSSTIRLLVWSVAIVLLIVTLFADTYVYNALCVASFHPIILFFSFYTAWFGLCAAISTSHFLWWGNWTRTDGLWMLVSWIFFVCVAATMFQNRKIKQWILWIFLGAVTSAALIGNTTGARLSGLIGNPLYLVQLLIFFPWLAFEATEYSKHRGKIVAIISLVVSVMIYTTSVRGAYIAFVCAIVWFIFELLKVRQKNAIIFLCFIGVTCISGYFLFGQKIYQRILQEPTAHIRLLLWHDSLSAIKTHPLFGVGFGNMDSILQKSELHVAQILFYEHPFDSTHNAYLDMLLQGGGGALLLFFIWAVVLYQRVGTQDSRSTFVALKRATLVFYFANGVTSFFTVWGNIPLGIALACVIANEAPRTLSFWQQKITRFFVWSVALVSGISALCIITTLAFHAHALYNAEIAQQHGDTVAFFSAFDATRGWSPFQREQDIHLISLTSKLIQDPVSLTTLEHVKDVAARATGIESEGVNTPEEDNTLAIFTTAYATQFVGEERIAQLAHAEFLQRRALEKSSGRPQSIFQLGEILYEEGRGKEALILLEHYAHEHPEFKKADEMYEAMKQIVGSIKN